MGVRRFDNSRVEYPLQEEGSPDHLLCLILPAMRTIATIRENGVGSWSDPMRMQD